MNTKTYEPSAGIHIQNACIEAVALADAENCEVEFTFNDIPLTAKPGEPPADIQKRWSVESDRRRKSWMESPERAEEQRRAHEAALEKAAKLEPLLDKAPGAPTVRDQRVWDQFHTANSDDPYGQGILTYANLWARLMEARIEAGEALPDIADECSRLADEEGITGFMYGCAVSLLAQAWIHGEELRRWHNKETQSGTEGDRANETGGVLNPAMLSVG